ncbi:SREBP regulating gene protein-like [Dysidea avara]|uniref:SREBP regulating gene protein-like n=1 Tax=Dysidea avara TaxID=196820 RepID=UPI003333A52C
MVALPRCLLRPKLYVFVISLVVTGTFVWYSTFEVTTLEKKEGTEVLNFEWLPLDNISYLENCRNSAQGSALIVDELGFVCSLAHLWSSGCCDSSSPNTKRFDCSNCLPIGCCSLYEHCVSCCLHPKKKLTLGSILKKLVLSESSVHLIYMSLRDQFEFCLTKCRTSSESVQHENSYKSPDYKYCFGIEHSSVAPVDDEQT